MPPRSRDGLSELNKLEVQANCPVDSATGVAGARSGAPFKPKTEPKGMP